MSEAELFEKHFPSLDEKQTLEVVAHEGVVVSMIGKRANPNVFVVKFATGKKTYLPLILNQTVAKMLLRVLSEQGF
jgi:hypothetical protein